MTSIARRAAARPSALSWNWALARRTGQEDLGGDDEHRQRRGEPHRPGEQAQPQGDRHQGDRHRGEGVEDQRREEGDPEGREARLAQPLGGLGDPLPLAGAAPERLEHGQPLEDVGDLASEGLDLAPPAGRQAPAGLPHQDAEDREERQDGEDDEGRRPVQGADHDHQGDRHGRRQHQVGQAAADVGVEGVEAATGERRHVAAAHPATAGSLAQRRAQQPPAELRLGGLGTVTGDDLGERGRRGRAR